MILGAIVSLPFLGTSLGGGGGRVLTRTDDSLVYSYRMQPPLRTLALFRWGNGCDKKEVHLGHPGSQLAWRQGSEECTLVCVGGGGTETETKTEMENQGEKGSNTSALKSTTVSQLVTLRQMQIIEW